MTTDLTVDEARLLAIYRAVQRSDHDIVRPMDAPVILEYLEVLIDFEKLEKRGPSEISTYLDGVVSGFAASRLVAAGIEPEALTQAPERYPAEVQTGVDPLTGDVRH